jgi:hypothetical protein
VSFVAQAVQTHLKNPVDSFPLKAQNPPNIARQGVTRTAVAIEFGVVTTDIHGNGSFTVVVGPIAAGTYDLEFDARNGAGCNLTGGGGNTTSTCEADFQSPGPTFGTAAVIIVP